MRNSKSSWSWPLWTNSHLLKLYSVLNHITVMSEIYSSTKAGRANHCIRKVDKTPVLVLLNLMCKKHDLTQKTLQSEMIDDPGWE